MLLVLINHTWACHHCTIDGTRGFSKDQLQGKQLLPTFRSDALVIFRAKVIMTWPLALKMTRASGRNVGESYFPLSWSLENPLDPSFWSQLRITVFITLLLYNYFCLSLYLVGYACTSLRHHQHGHSYFWGLGNDDTPQEHSLFLHTKFGQLE